MARRDPADGLVRLLRDLGIEQQIRQIGVVAVGAHDVGQKRGADDAAAGPDAGDLGQVEIPGIGGTRRVEQRHPLGVGGDFREVEGILERGERSVRAVGTAEQGGSLLRSAR